MKKMSDQLIDLFKIFNVDYEIYVDISIEFSNDIGN